VPLAGTILQWDIPCFEHDGTPCPVNCLDRRLVVSPKDRDHHTGFVGRTEALYTTSIPSLQRIVVYRGATSHTGGGEQYDRRISTYDCVGQHDVALVQADASHPTGHPFGWPNIVR
jgi:hypothetical protein